MTSTDESSSLRPRIQVSVSADLLVLVRRIGAVTGESDPQVVLRGLLDALPAMLRASDDLRSGVQAVEKSKPVPPVQGKGLKR